MIRQYIVDAFTDTVFHGNQAAICVTESWPSDELMMDITRENNFSETAFAVPEGEGYHLRWLTPGGEIDLCGHATLACAYVLFRFFIPDAESVTFFTLSGDLVVNRRGDMLEMDFPAYELCPVPVTEEMTEALGVEPLEAFLGRDLILVLSSEDAVRSLMPDVDRLRGLDGLLQHVTARGTETDCVSRSFAPKLGVKEDPVCGSGHCHIVPYWANRLQKEGIVAYQASQRGGTLYCHMAGDRVIMAGKAALYSVGELNV